MHNSFPKNRSELTDIERQIAIREYLGDLERFAVGCNLNAYDISIVNKMSGGSLVSNYNKYFKSYIEDVRRNLYIGSPIKSSQLYVEVEKMIERLCEVREEPFYKPENYPEEKRVLEKFLEIPISSSEEVFNIFRSLPNSVEDHGTGKEGYLYVPGNRRDRCLLVAHADTYFDVEYQDCIYENEVILNNGVYHGVKDNASIGMEKSMDK